MSPETTESALRVALRLARDSRLVSEAQAEFFGNRGLSRELVATWPDKARATLNDQWSVSSEKARLDIALACVTDLPCADIGLESWRYPSPYGGAYGGWIMICARDHDDALREVSRSIAGKPDPALLERWNWPAKAYLSA
jgi:hypothetical protein